MSRNASIHVDPITNHPSLRKLAYDALKSAIADLDIYGSRHELRLDERRLSKELGISRTPVREAISILEQEGFVISRARKGTFVIKKSKKQIVDIIYTWTAFESMAARFACTRASDGQLKSLRALFSQFDEGLTCNKIDEYSDANLRFHQEIVALGQCSSISRLSNNLLMHLRSIRRTAIKHGDRASSSIVEHVKIIDALEARRADLAGSLVRDHGLGLARHIDTHGTYLGNSLQTSTRVGASSGDVAATLAPF